MMSDQRVRVKYFNLPSQQRRLRHLRSIAARNVALHTDDTQQQQPQVVDMGIFFTLHQDNASKAFYTSEKIEGSMNPTWRSFNLDHVPLDGVNTASNSFVLKVWRGREHRYRLCMEWTVDLRGLEYCGDKLLGQSVQYPANAIIFGMFEGFYVEPSSGDPSTQSPSTSVDSPPEIDPSTVRTSYSVQTLLRIQTVLRATKQTQSTVAKVRRSIEEKLNQSHTLHNKKSAREVCALRVGLCRAELQWRMNKLQQEKDDFEALQAANYKRDERLKGRFESLHKDKMRLHEKKKSYFDVREELIKSGAQLVMRRKQLISELTFIYPINEMSSTVYSIAGVRLPNSEDFAGESDTMIEVALGYTCHLVQMISHFLDVPPRYPMMHRCSRSQIRDHIMEKLLDKDRDFPLFTKGKERFQFNYGVYLINKNIAQLRYYCGLGTTDLRLTLPNLKSLLELRLGVKFETSSGPHNAMANQHLSVPPNLGGPQRASPFFSSKPQSQHNHRPPPQHKEEPKPKVLDDEIHLHEVETKKVDTVDGDTDSQSTCSDSKHRIPVPAALYDDLEASSSADSTNAKYGSKFKMWSKTEKELGSDVPKPVEVKASTPSSKFKMWSKDGQDAVSSTAGPSTVAESTEENGTKTVLRRTSSLDSTSLDTYTRLGSLDGYAEVTFDVQNSYARNAEQTPQDNGIKWTNDGDDSQAESH